MKKSFFYTMFIGLFLFLIMFDSRLVSAQTEKELAPEKLVSFLMKKHGSDYDLAVKYINAKHPPEVAKLLTGILTGNEEGLDRDTAFSALKLFPFPQVKDLYLSALEKTPSNVIKREIILFAGKQTDRAFVPLIARELENPFATVREAAIATLRDIGDDRMFPVIFKMSESRDAVFKIYALESLNQLYDIRLFNIIQNLLADENKSVRILAMQCAEKNNLDKLIPAIRKMAQSDINTEVRVSSIHTLVKMNDQGGIQVISKTLSAAEREIRFASAVALSKLKSRQSLFSISEQLAVETDNHIKYLLIDILADMRDGGGFKGLEEMIEHETYQPLKVKTAVVLSIIGGNRSMQILIRALKDKDFKVRAEAASSLASFRDKAVTLALVSVVTDDSERYTRLAALYSLERIRDRAAVIPLYDRYSAEKDPVMKSKLFDITRTLIQSSI